MSTDRTDTGTTALTPMGNGEAHDDDTAGGGTAPATAAQPAPSVIVTRASALVRSVTPDRFIAAAVGAAAVYAAAWLLSLVFTVLAFVAAADASLDWGLAFAAPAQIVGVALAGTLTIGATVMGVSAAVSLLWLPLLVTAFLIVATALVARRDERMAPSASRGIRWLLSALTGLVLAILVVVIAAVTPLRYAVGDGADAGFGMLSGEGTASSASVTAFLGALIVGTLVAYLARAAVARRNAGVNATVVPRAATSVLAAVRSTVPVVGLHLGALATLLAVALLIWAVVNGGVNALLTAFFWLPTLVVNALGLVNLVPVTFSGALGALAGLAGSPSSFWMPSILPGWATVLVLIVNLGLILVTGMVLSLRRAQLKLSTAMSWLTTILIFAAVGVAISIVGSIAAWTSVDTAGAGESLDGFGGGIASLIEGVAAASGTLGLAAWAFIVFAALGALVEVVAVFVAPTLVQLVPAAALARVGRLTGLVGVPFAMPGSAPADVAVDAALANSPAPAPVAVSETGETDLSGTAAAPDAVGAPAVPMTAEKKRRLRIILVSAGAALVVVLGASIATSVVNQMIYSPEHQVERYLDALVAGDASTALELGDVDASAAERVLLTDAMLAATDDGVSGYTITDVSTTGDTSLISVRVDQAGVKEEMSFGVQKTGKTALVFDQWTLDPVWVPSLPISFSTGISKLDINGVTVELTPEDKTNGYFEALAFAGTYVVGAAGNDEWLAAEPQTVQMGVVAAESAAQLELEPTAEFIASVDEQVAGYLADCVAQKSLNADDCPIYTYEFGTVTDVVWTIDESAVTSLETSYDGEWYVSTDERGSATVTYTNTSYSGAVEQETQTVPFSINGIVSLNDDGPFFSSGY